jgi:tetratricopeptide (TPR) repeat protein
MQRLFPIALSMAAIALLVAPQIAHGQEFDQIFPIPSGAPIRGTVTNMTRSSVTIDVGGVKREVPVNGIRRLNFATDPGELRTARDNISTGRFEDAKEDLAKINLAGVTQEVVKADIAFFKAYADAELALTGTVDKEAAHGALLSFVQNNSQNYHFFEAAELLGDLAMARGKFAEAQSYYRGLEQADWPKYKMRAAILQAKALLPQKNFAEAMKMYDTVIASSLSTPEVNREKEFAKIGRVVCLANQGDVQQAEQIVNEIIQKNDAKDTALFGRAYNALGAVHVKAGKPKLALTDYLHTDLLFYTDPEVHAEALYFLSKLWNDAAKNSDEALRTRELLKARYPGSLWSQLE